MSPSRCVFASFAAIALPASMAAAVGVPVGHIQLNDSFGTTNGGEFRATEQADFTVVTVNTGTNFQGGIVTAANLFETFCVEKYEHIGFGTNYAASINTTTHASDSNYAGGAHGGYDDPIDARTAYLYTNFMNHTLAAGYDYANATNRAADADALQKAIWYIEQEDSTALTGKALTLLNEANNAVNSGAWTGLGNVRVLNLTTSAGADAQDQLVMIVTSIPLPGAAGMAGLGLVGVAARRRRR